MQRRRTNLYNGQLQNRSIYASDLILQTIVIFETPENQLKLKAIVVRSYLIPMQLRPMPSFINNDYSQIIYTVSQ